MRAGGEVRFVLATAGALGLAMATGCGGSSGSSSSSSADSGEPATDGARESIGSDGAARDASATTQASAEAGPSGEDAATDAADALPLLCEVDADITDLGDLDASLGDSGLTVAGCLSCVQASCGMETSACNGDCACKVTVKNFIECVANGGTESSCSGVVLAADSTAIELLSCLVAASCVASMCGG